MENISLEPNAKILPLQKLITSGIAFIALLACNVFIIKVINENAKMLALVLLAICDVMYLLQIMKPLTENYFRFGEDKLELRHLELTEADKRLGKKPHAVTDSIPYISIKGFDGAKLETEEKTVIIPFDYYTVKQQTQIMEYLRAKGVHVP